MMSRTELSQLVFVDFKAIKAIDIERRSTTILAFGFLDTRSSYQKCLDC
jgi:hypothetical protein